MTINDKVDHQLRFQALWIQDEFMWQAHVDSMLYLPSESLPSLPSPVPANIDCLNVPFWVPLAAYLGKFSRHDSASRIYRGTKRARAESYDSRSWASWPSCATKRLSISDTTSDASPPTRHKLCPQILNQFDRVSSVHEAHPANHAARLNLFDLENVGSHEKI